MPSCKEVLARIDDNLGDDFIEYRDSNLYISSEITNIKISSSANILYAEIEGNFAAIFFRGKFVCPDKIIYFAQLRTIKDKITGKFITKNLLIEFTENEVITYQPTQHAEEMFHDITHITITHPEKNGSSWNFKPSTSKAKQKELKVNNEQEKFYLLQNDDGAGPAIENDDTEIKVNQTKHVWFSEDVTEKIMSDDDEDKSYTYAEEKKFNDDFQEEFFTMFGRYPKTKADFTQYMEEKFSIDNQMQAASSDIAAPLLQAHISAVLTQSSNEFEVLSHRYQAWLEKNPEAEISFKKFKQFYDMVARGEDETDFAAITELYEKELLAQLTLEETGELLEYLGDDNQTMQTGNAWVDLPETSITPNSTAHNDHEDVAEFLSRQFNEDPFMGTSAVFATK